MRRNRRFSTSPTPTAATEPSDACPVCGATGDEPCRDKNGRKMGREHAKRSG